MTVAYSTTRFHEKIWADCPIIQGNAILLRSKLSYFDVVYLLFSTMEGVRTQRIFVRAQHFSLDKRARATLFVRQACLRDILCGQGRLRNS